MSKDMANVRIDSNVQAYQMTGVNLHKTVKSLCCACNTNMSTTTFNVGCTFINICDECKEKLKGILGVN